jgi:hypothetical protein
LVVADCLEAVLQLLLLLLVALPRLRLQSPHFLLVLQLQQQLHLQQAEVQQAVFLEPHPELHPVVFLEQHLVEESQVVCLAQHPGSSNKSLVRLVLPLRLLLCHLH